MIRDLRLRLPREELHRLYTEEKKSLEDIARLYGVSKTAIWKYCKDEGLIRRTRSEARLEAQKRGKVPQNYFHINERFFSTWSSEMAYVLGLLITDGCISGGGVISLNINDKDLLEKIRQTMASEHKIIPSKHQKGLYLFCFSRSKLLTDLYNLGLLPKKSLCIKFPKVPGVFLADFVRGIFDGDGSVFFEKRNKNCPVVSKFCSGSKDFIIKLEASLQKLGLPRRNIYEQNTKNGIFYMFKYGHRDSKSLFDILYKNVEKGLFLERKYRVFVEGLHIGAEDGKRAQ